MTEVKSKKPLQDAIQNGEQNIKVTDPKCCSFIAHLIKVRKRIIILMTVFRSRHPVKTKSQVLDC